jgi:hypothetical protein
MIMVSGCQDRRGITVIMRRRHDVRLYEACQESNDTARVGRYGKFLCLLWQHCRRPCSFTCEPCFFDNGRTGFV